MELEKFLARCTYMLRRNMAEVSRPDGDIEPSLFHYFEGESVREMALPRAAFANRATKDVMIEILTAATRLMVPDFIAFQATQWAIEVDGSKLSSEERHMAIEANLHPKSIPMPSEHPDRWEIVGVVAMDGDRYLAKQSRIERDGVNPPVYGPWEERYDSVSGAMVTPLQDVLREARIKSGR